jgi:4-hydroxythreonine-4-phosphate dehydrogenase
MPSPSNRDAGLGHSGSPYRIAVTTGDPDGIGLEVTAKALQVLGPQPGVQFILWRSDQALPRHLDWIQEKFNFIRAVETADVWRQDWSAKEIIDVCSAQPPADWVVHAALACRSGLCDAVVTGPLSKSGMHTKERPYLGHTELLAHVTGSKNLFMSFWGKRFAVVLATGHIPIREVPKALTPHLLDEAVAQAVKLRDVLRPEEPRRPVAVVGLNPHAGEAGLIGGEEDKWMRRLVSKWSEHGVEGPLVPDAAFLPKMQDKYSVFVCPYHDQGLIPFKLVHGFNSGVHVTLGLPFVRTSVDHGTAKEIYGLDQAEYGSMKDAIQTAISLVQRRRFQEGSYG